MPCSTTLDVDHALRLAFFAMGGTATWHTEAGSTLSALAFTPLDVDHALLLALFAMGGSAAWHTEVGLRLSV